MYRLYIIKLFKMQERQTGYPTPFELMTEGVATLAAAALLIGQQIPDLPAEMLLPCFIYTVNSLKHSNVG